MIPTSDITGLILAGGRGSRMGGVDKGLQVFNGAPMAMHTLMRLSPQVGHMLINANRNLAAYESFGVPVVVDSVPDFAGPLAGVLAGLEQCQTPYLLTAPCDSPFVPIDLAAKLSQALVEAGARIALPVTLEPDENGQPRRQVQPVFCLLDATLADDLTAYLQQGGRKIDAWTARHPSVEVVFDDAAAFANINTLAELRQLAERR
ncbi:molybdenum cofactor guanylyltransferase MobA (plasmid) [Ralstonia syzygii subsp. celebesensis]|uniref:Molybdenum cofactor guanylyltransferase n=5 Tax=Ralstonia solanacearum species complex TaxID=3116862 RepID=A0AAD0S7F1_RALSL|nr:MULTISPECIES: molybdenum cofactor guanylyltransferase MobA [Ralstonia solanacearum species complex]CCA83042.1 molybdopterin-guanine dinucleotide biosynthesis protein A [blood disease bacterium R229]AQW32182.1 molybdenum cofactor guanylyltransferase [blood disease bacterium A2-HR MARDI]AXV82078.1 molybdenum cofactor guanylyltransferase [Ralstonia solanacearum]AXW53208.1 molybdenum cofactor guanylyltransferase [Ralstonia solanacearum]QQV57627.1 molybdenum cofactor guanylyltransferase MobA [Ra